MFKTDKKSLESLSFRFNERDIANLKALIEYFRENKLLTIPNEESQRLLAGLDEIGKLRLNGKVYGFHVEDSFAEEGYDTGVELYLRQGDKLEPCCQFSHRDRVPDVKKAVEHLRKKRILTIYTGPIPYQGEFLGLPHEEDKDDPLLRLELSDNEIEEFKEEGIKVIKLEKLI